jgi:hypothetical protein
MEYPYQAPYNTAMSGPAAQDYSRNSPVGPPSHFTTTLPPASPTELTSPMTSSIGSSPRYSPMATSRISGPSTLSALNTSGVTAHSLSPATPLNRASQSPGFYGPESMRQSPISPSQKRPFEYSADDSLVCNLNYCGDIINSILQHGRRVTPRHDGASNVHSLPSAAGTSTTALSISSGVPGRGPTIPQQLYNVGTTHAFHFTTGGGMPVAFNVVDGTGVPLQQLLHRQAVRLQAKDERILDMSGDTISIRIEVKDPSCLKYSPSDTYENDVIYQWPGYPSYTKQIASKDWKKERSPNTRERLATKVAEAARSFFKVSLS